MVSCRRYVTRELMVILSFIFTLGACESNSDKLVKQFDGQKETEQDGNAWWQGNWHDSATQHYVDGDQLNRRPNEGSGAGVINPDLQWHRNPFNPDDEDNNVFGSGDQRSNADSGTHWHTNNINNNNNNVGRQDIFHSADNFEGSGGSNPSGVGMVDNYGTTIPWWEMNHVNRERTTIGPWIDPVVARVTDPPSWQRPATTPYMPPATSKDTPSYVVGETHGDNMDIANSNNNNNNNVQPQPDLTAQSSPTQPPQIYTPKTAVPSDIYEFDNNRGSTTLEAFKQPGILSAIIAGSLVGLLSAITLVIFIVYRMRKKDEGSYALDEPKGAPPAYPYAYAKASTKEFYA